MQAANDYKEMYEQSQLTIATLRHELDQLKKMIFGSKQERFVSVDPHPEQLSLNIHADPVASTSVIDAKRVSYVKTKTLTTAPVHPVRMRLPDHLERHDIVLEPTGKTDSCRKISEEVTEELDFTPGSFFVNRYVRPKYVQDNQIIIADLPDRPLSKAIAGAGLLAQIVIDKYVDHLPLYRQQQRFSREQVNIPYATITDWVSGTCQLITPLYEALKKEVLHSDYLHADETPIKVLDKEKKGETHRGYYWVYHNSMQDMVLFDYRAGRGREGPDEILQTFKGHLQTDGYSAYNIFEQRKDITLLHCWAHARRKFFEAQDSDPERSVYALEQIGKLYTIERSAKEQQLTAAQIALLRQEQSLPVLDSLHQWMKDTYINALPKSPIGKAVAYSLERWDKLKIYTTDGKLNIDNNAVENSIRPVAIGRKNYLFAGSHEAAQRSAMLYSLMGTCKLHDVNPFIWLRDVLQRINQHPINRITELLPNNWQPIS